MPLTPANDIGGSATKMHPLVLLWLSLFVFPVSSAAVEGEPIPSPALKCKIQQVAYEYGKSLAPSYGKFEALYNALGLNADPCSSLAGSNFSSGAGIVFSEEDRNPLPPVFSSSASGPTFYVDYQKGSDSAAGTSVSTPFKTLDAALSAVSASGSSTSTILLREGTHYLSDTARIAPEHSGLTIQNYNGEKVVVSGAIPLAGQTNEWKPEEVTDKKNIYSLKVSGLTKAPGLLVEGKRATRARYPNGNCELAERWELEDDEMDKTSSSDSTTPYWQSLSPFPVLGSSGEVKYGAPLPPTTNTTYYNVPEAYRRNTSAYNDFQIYEIGTGGPCSWFNPPVSYWCSKTPGGGGASVYEMFSSFTPGPKSGLNTPYKTLDNAVLMSYHPMRWANWFFSLSDAAKTKDGAWGFASGGWQDSRGRQSGGDWYIENIREELDFPNEFFWEPASSDVDESTLYFFYNGTGAPPSPSAFEVPNLARLVEVKGTQAAPVVNVTIQGITFSGTSATYLTPNIWAVPSGGDWALDREAAIFIEGTEGVKVTQCNVTRVDGNGIGISGYNRRLSVSSNALSYIGGTAIWSWGITNETSAEAMYGFDGTDGNHPLGTEVSENVISEVGVFVKQASCFFQAKSAFTKLSNNLCFNGPRAGVNLNDGFGGGDEITGNLIFNMVRETQDHGPFNSWDRQPFWTVYGTEDGTPSTQMAWRTISRNFIFNNYHPQEAIDNDDGSAYYYTHNNVIVGGQAVLKTDFNGHDNHHFENLDLFSVSGLLLITPQQEKSLDQFYSNRVFLTSSQLSATTNCDYAQYALSWNNTFYTPDGKLSLCKVDFNGKNQTNAVLKSDSVSDDEIISTVRTYLSL